MPIFRRTMIVQIELPSSATEESLPLTCEREFGVFLRADNQVYPANSFVSPINDEQWRTFVRQMRDCNVNHDDTGFRGAQAIRSIGRNLYQSLCALSPKLQEFLDDAGTSRRLVIQTTRPELHLLPWAALYDLSGKYLPAGDLSIVQSWQSFSESPLTTPARLNLVRVLGADTNKTTVLSLLGLPPEITMDAAGPCDVLHLEEHGNAVLSEIGGVSANAMAESFAASRIALLWSCYSSAANSWGDSPALALHRSGAGLVLSFQAELHNLDARSISDAFYADVFGPAASRDPESALVRIRVAKFTGEFEYANWASMTVYLSSPLDLSAMALNGPRVPAALWLADDALPTATAAAPPSISASMYGIPTPPSSQDPWANLATAVEALQPGTMTGIDAPYDTASLKLPLRAVKPWRGNVIRLDGTDDPLSDAAILEMNLRPGDAPKTDAADKLVWFFQQIAHYGSPLVIWTNALPRHLEFVKTAGANSNLTFFLLYGPPQAPTLPELVDLNLLDQAQAMAEALPANCADDEVLSAAYFAFARCSMPDQAKAILSRIKSHQEVRLLCGNFVSRFGIIPGLCGEPDREVGDLERKHCEQDFYSLAMDMTGAESNLREVARAKHELGYLMSSQGRLGTAEIFYRAALQDLERSPDHDTRWHSALARVLRDWADLIATNPARLDEAGTLLRRAMAIHRFHGRILEIAYSLATSAQIARTAGNYAKAVDDALEAANRFEDCANWWGWSSAVKILLDSLAETRETVRMQSLIHLGLQKIQLSTLAPKKKEGIKRTLMFELARAHWIAGDLIEAREALEQVFEGAPPEFRETDAGREADRLYRFLALSQPTVQLTSE